MSHKKHNRPLAVKATCQPGNYGFPEPVRTQGDPVVPPELKGSLDGGKNINAQSDAMTEGLYKTIQGAESGQFSHKSTGIVAKIQNLFKTK